MASIRAGTLKEVITVLKNRWWVVQNCPSSQRSWVLAEAASKASIMTFHALASVSYIVRWCGRKGLWSGSVWTVPSGVPSLKEIPREI